MKWNIQFDESNGFVRAYQSGDFSLTDQAAFLLDIVRSPNWRYGMPLMIDFCHLVVDNIHLNEMTSTSDLILKIRSELGPGKIAMLCDDDIQFGLGRQFQMMTEIELGREIRIYRDEFAAVRFLTSESLSAPANI